MAISYDEMREKVARAICASVGKDPDSQFVDRHGRPSGDIKEWERWGGEAGAAIRAIHEYLSASDTGWEECQECGVGRELARLLPRS